MEKIFEQAKDLHVVATLVYNNGDEFAYTDAECTKKFKVSELKEVFVKGAMIVIDNAFYAPVSYSEAGIGYIDAEGKVATLGAESNETETESNETETESDESQDETTENEAE